MTPVFWTPDQYRGNILRPLGEVTNAMERTGCVVSLPKLREIAGEARNQKAQ